MPRHRQQQKTDVERPYLEVGTRVKEFRLSKGLNQLDLTAAGVSEITIRRVEMGYNMPPASLLIYLRVHHGADINVILCGK